MILSFQSTLPHGSDTAKLAIRNGTYVISIHAPSRERRDFIIALLRGGDFNPRSLTGATLRRLLPLRQTLTFQSTLPHGSDLLPDELLQQYPISIHAPSRERRGTGWLSCTAYAISIHAPSRERLRVRKFAPFGTIFQSTLPHGSDSSLMTRSVLLIPFQSTLPHGSDSCGVLREHSVIISIHAPSRERPTLTFMTLRPTSHFNPRSLTGATVYCPKFSSAVRFQSTLPHGSD